MQANYAERSVTAEHVTQMARILGVKDLGRPRTMSMPFVGSSPGKAGSGARPPR